MPETNQTSAVVSTKTGNRTLRIVLIIFGVLFIAVASELGYYFYTSAKRDRAIKDQNITTPSQGQGQTRLYIEKALTFGEDLDKTPGNFYKEAKMTNTMEGKVVSVEKGNLLVNPNGPAYILLMEDDNKNKSKWYVPQEEVDTAKIYLLSPSGAKQKITFEDIKPGDYLSARQTVDLLDPKPEYDVTLTVTRNP